MSDSRRRGLLRLKARLEHNEATGEEMAKQRSRFQSLATDEARPRIVTAFNLFQTPPELAARMVELAGDLSGRILEPSAGLGRIYRAIRDRTDSDVTLVEQSADCCGELFASASNARLIQGDFLACDVDRLGGRFDRVIMNPPFKQGRDVKHVRHAVNMLKPGGVLVALCYDGARQQCLRNEASHWEQIPAGTFEGTRAASVLLTIQTFGRPE